METNSMSRDSISISPEKLAVMKMRISGLDQNASSYSEPVSPSGLQKSFAFGGTTTSQGMQSSSLTRRSSRFISGSSRRASTFLQSHRNKMSMELTSHAEGKFFALMDMMSTASREASSLKESWARILSERDGMTREKEELLLRIDELTEEIARVEAEHRHHHHDHSNRKARLDKALIELTAAISMVSEHKNIVAARDRELETLRSELNELRMTITTSHSDRDKTKAELESTLAKLKACEADRDAARQTSQSHHNELRTLTREHTELKSKFTETSGKFDTSRKEILTLTDRIKIFELERDEHLHEKDRMQEDLKRTRSRAEETNRELLELTERNDRSYRETNKLKETIRVLETERDDHALSVDNLRREVKVKSDEYEQADSRNAELNLKYEHIKREVVSVKEKLRDIELERNELRDTLDRAREDYRLIVIECDQQKQDIDEERRKLDDANRRISVLDDSLHRAELTITDLRSQINTLTERTKVLVREADEHRSKHSHAQTSIGELKAQISALQSELRDVTHTRDNLHAELNSWKHKYEEVTETITSFDDSHVEFEFEIESLRTLLREARAQKEAAIAARQAADRERDTALAKFEDKCRELERYEESASSMYHVQWQGRNGGGKKEKTRTVSSGTTLHHEGHESHGSGILNSS